MDRQLVTSSIVHSIGYDEQLHALEVEFKHTATVYRYTGVSAEEYRELMNATSIGSYLKETIEPRHRNIRIL